MSETDGEIHGDGTADGPEHIGESLGADGGVPPVVVEGPADAPAGSSGIGSVSDGGADGSVDETPGASGFDGTVDTPVFESAEQESAEGRGSAYAEDWKDEGADGPSS